MTDNQRTLVERRNRCAIITLNAPERRNAIDAEMVTSLHRDLDVLSSDRDLAVIVIIGAGDKAFAAGADIAQLKERTAADAMAAINSGLFKRIEDFAVPSIAAIRGWCLGGGCELAMACDLRVAGKGARMGQPEVSLGIIPAAGATYRMPRLVGLGRARELIYTGRIIDAEEAERIGLVNRVVSDDQVLDEALKLATEIGHNGARAVRLAKSTMNALARANESMAVAMESTAQAVLFDCEDKHQRMSAFLERKNKNKS